MSRWTLRAVLGALLVAATTAAAQTPALELPALITRLKSGAATDVRVTAARALGASRDPRALPPLVAALGEENRDVRWAAIEALSELGDRRAVPPLLEYLKRQEAYRWGKRLVANALGALGDPAAVDALAGLFADEDPFVRRTAAFALLRIGDARGIRKVAELTRGNADDTLGSVRRELALAEETAGRAMAARAAEPAAAREPLRPHEWAGLRVAATRTGEARMRFGAPLQETSSFALFSGERFAGPVRADSVVVNADTKGQIESIFVFPVWGTLDRDVRALLGQGTLMPYADFLKTTGRTRYGAGTTAGEKLHYVPPQLMSESYPEMGMLVIYDTAEPVASERLVKLIIVY